MSSKLCKKTLKVNEWQVAEKVTKKTNKPFKYGLGVNKTSQLHRKVLNAST